MVAADKDSSGSANAFFDVAESLPGFFGIFLPGRSVTGFLFCSADFARRSEALVLLTGTLDGLCVGVPLPLVSPRPRSLPLA